MFNRFNTKNVSNRLSRTFSKWLKHMLFKYTTFKKYELKTQKIFNNKAPSAMIYLFPMNVVYCMKRWCNINVDS